MGKRREKEDFGKEGEKVLQSPPSCDPVKT